MFVLVWNVGEEIKRDGSDTCAPYIIYSNGKKILYYGFGCNFVGWKIL